MDTKLQWIVSLAAIIILIMMALPGVGVQFGQAKQMQQDDHVILLEIRDEVKELGVDLTQIKIDMAVLKHQVGEQNGRIDNLESWQVSLEAR